MTNSPSPVESIKVAVVLRADTHDKRTTAVVAKLMPERRPCADFAESQDSFEMSICKNRCLWPLPSYVYSQIGEKKGVVAQASNSSSLIMSQSL